MDIPYLEFYVEHNISPVTQIIKNKKRFFTQRQYLYQRLGITPSFLKNKDIIEFGPGNGVNAIFNYSFLPNKCVLVDGNPLAIENIKKNFSEHFQNLEMLEVIHCLFEEFDHQPSYDLVICENFIANLAAPVPMAVMLSKNVRPGGVFFITCNDAASLLSETLRSLVGLILTRGIEHLHKKSAFLADYFFSHLSALNNVERSFEDWVLDNILQERYALHAPLFSIAEAIEGIGDSFTFYHSSPALHTEMRWHRSVDSEIVLKNTNEAFLNSYYRNMLNILDYRLNVSPHSTELGKVILEFAQQIRTLCRLYYQNSENKTLKSLIDKLSDFADLISPLSIDTGHALQGYAEIFRSGSFEKMNTSHHLINWWGRGSQHVSFVRD